MVKRSYHAPRRQQQAAETRAAVIAAAHRLFVEQGYEATSIRQIASEAQVTGQTIFRIFGTKAALLQDALLAAYAGDSDAVPGRELEDLFAAVGAEATPTARIRALGAWSLASYARGSRDLEEVVFDAARTDPRVAEFAGVFYDRIYQDSLAMVRAVAGDHRLPDGITAEDIAEFVYAVWNIPTYRELVNERGWTVDKYVAWMVLLMERMFIAYLDPPPDVDGQR